MATVSCPTRSLPWARRVEPGCEQLLDELEAEADDKSYEAHMAKRAEQEAATGRPIRGRSPTPDSATHRSRQHANTTDPESRLLKTRAGFVQGYNAQAVATDDQFVVAAEVTNHANDATAFAPMIAAAKTNLGARARTPAFRRVRRRRRLLERRQCQHRWCRSLHRTRPGEEAQPDRRG